MGAFRTEKVASVIRRVVGEAISAQLSDPRISPLTSVTRVEVSADLMHARVRVSVMGSEAEQRRTLSGLTSARRFLQSLLAGELQTRTCPRLNFQLDPSIKGALETNRLIDESLAEDAARHTESAAPEEADEP